MAENKPDKSEAQDPVLLLLGIVHGVLYAACADLFVDTATDILVKAWLSVNHDFFLESEDPHGVHVQELQYVSHLQDGVGHG